MENLNTTDTTIVKNSETPTPENEHAEAVAFVEKNRDFFEHYAKGKLKIEPAPPEIETFAINLETNTIYVNAMFYQKFGFSEQKTVFATLHEIEHLMEKLQILSEEGGERRFDNFLKRIKESRAYSLMDNHVSDIRENRKVVSWEPIGLGDLEKKIYTEDLFPVTDFTSQPRHIQFSQALLRESRVPDESCQVSADVRSALDEVAQVEGLMDIMTDPDTPMSMRWRLQDKYLLPKMEALLEKDVEDKKNYQNNESGQGSPGEARGSENQEETEGGKPDEESDPNIIFADEYTEAEKKFPEAVPVEEIEKAFREWKEVQKSRNSADKADEEYAHKIGVEKQDLQEYRKIVDSLEKIVNPETDVSIIEELKNLFNRIISKRVKVAQSPKYPVEEGDELVDPAQLVADVKSGNLRPKVWEDTEIKERKGDRFGEVEITLVFDRSSSMKEGQKAIQQQKSAVLAMEVLKEFADLCESEKNNIDKSLEVKSEIYSFANNSEDGLPLKKMSPELGEAERVNVLKKLHNLPGTTTDFNCLEAVNANLDENTKNKIKIGELKKIILVFTDGGSDNSLRVQGVLKSLRDGGVVAIGIGMTGAGKPAVTTYAPNALVVEDVSKLPLVLAELLKEHLKDL